MVVALDREFRRHDRDRAAGGQKDQQPHFRKTDRRLGVLRPARVHRREKKQYVIVLVPEFRVRPQGAAQYCIGQEKQAKSDQQTAPAGATILPAECRR